ncbi:MAG: hypothetical protein WBB55_01850 [Anaerolineales bacterium]
MRAKIDYEVVEYFIIPIPIPLHALSEVNVQFLILTAWQGIPCRSKTLDGAAARHAP